MLLLLLLMMLACGQVWLWEAGFLRGGVDTLTQRYAFFTRHSLSEIHTPLEYYVANRGR